MLGGGGAGVSAFYGYVGGSKGHYSISVNSNDGGGFISVSEPTGLGAPAVPDAATWMERRIGFQPDQEVLAAPSDLASAVGGQNGRI
jgi:hypothetical protein